MSQYNFFVLAPNPWKSQWMNRQQICSRLTQYGDVHYSTGCKYSWDLAAKSDLFSQPKSSWHEMNGVKVFFPSSLWVRIPKIGFFDNLIKSQFSKAFTNGQSKVSASTRQAVNYVFHPEYADYLSSMPEGILVYHPYDNFSKQGTFTQQMRDKEQWLMENADLVITPSKGVSLALSQDYKRDQVETVHNGVDFAAFSACAADEPLSQREKKRVAYVGSINVKVDIAVLLHLLKNMPDTEFVMVGPVGVMADKQSLFDELKQCPNVTFMGPQSHLDLPAISASMDCLLMCYDTSPALWAEHAYPLKLNEYLAVKKPVVSCPLPSVPGIADYLDVASTPDEWLASVSNALNTPDREKIEAGYAYAQHQDWQNRAEQIFQLIEKAQTK